jgi:hypothetical protein
MCKVAQFPKFLSEPFTSPLSDEESWRWMLRARCGLAVHNDSTFHPERTGGSLPRNVRPPMKRLMFGSLLTGALVLSAWQLGQARGQSQLAEFQIVVEPSARGLKATCARGCAWKTLTFTCDPNAACKAGIDEQGVGGVK